VKKPIRYEYVLERTVTMRKMASLRYGIVLIALVVMLSACVGRQGGQQATEEELTAADVRATITVLENQATAQALGEEPAEAAEEMPAEPTTAEAAPAMPTAAPAEPTAAPAEPTAAPAEPTAAPAEPTADPAEPTAAPATAAPAEPTAAPAEPTAAPATATTAPAEPTAAPTEEEAAAPAEEEAAPAADGGAAPDPASVGDPAAGETLFNKAIIGTAAGCKTCHYVDASRGDFTGPNQANVANEAGTRVEGQSAVEYLRNSIVNPNDYVVEGYSAGVMPLNYGDLLSEEEVNDLVAYLLTLDGS
jgi:cytochrome c2